MRFLIGWMLLGLGCATYAGTNVGAPEAAAAWPAAESVLARARDQLPREPLILKGHVLCGRRRGLLEKTYLVEAELRFGADPATARYTLRDVFGATVSRLSVRRDADGAATLRYEAGDPLQPAPMPDLRDPIRPTQLTWSDLTLACLWWRDGRTLGRGSHRSRDCWMLEFDLPPDAAPAAPPAASEAPGPAVSARVWLDEKMRLFLQMEERDARGQAIRRVAVKNFKKMAGAWMIKDIEVLRLPSRERTVIRIDEVAGPDGLPLPEEEPADSDIEP